MSYCLSCGHACSGKSVNGLCRQCAQKEAGKAGAVAEHLRSDIAALELDLADARRTAEKAGSEREEHDAFLHEIHEALAEAGHPTLACTPGPDGGDDGITHVECVRDLAKERDVLFKERDNLKARLDEPIEAPPPLPRASDAAPGELADRASIEIEKARQCLVATSGWVLELEAEASTLRGQAGPPTTTPSDSLPPPHPKAPPPPASAGGDMAEIFAGRAYKAEAEFANAREEASLLKLERDEARLRVGVTTEDAIRDSDALGRLSQELRALGLRGGQDIGAVDAALVAIDRLAKERDDLKTRMAYAEQARDEALAELRQFDNPTVYTVEHAKLLFQGKTYVRESLLHELKGARKAMADARRKAQDAQGLRDGDTVVWGVFADELASLLSIDVEDLECWQDQGFMVKRRRIEAAAKDLREKLAAAECLLAETTRGAVQVNADLRRGREIEAELGRMKAKDEKQLPGASGS